MLLNMSIAAIASASVMSLGSHTIASNATTTNPSPVKKSQTVATAKKSKNKVVAAAEPVQPAPEQPVMVTVQAGDYLEKIATANSTTAQRLFDANTSIASPDLIFPGQQLRVPKADEVLAAREVPVPVAPEPTPAPAAAVAVPTPAPAPVAAAPAVSGGGVWDRLAACESGGNWAINTGNGFYGGLQFTLSSWRAVGGSGYPNQASREEQIMRGQMLQSRGGWGNWPACSAKLGLL